MKVAIYHPWIYVKSGLERTIMEVFRRSRHEWTIYTSHYDADATYPDLKGMQVTEVKPVSVKRRYGTVIQASAKIASTDLALDEFDALVVCCDGIGSFINIRNSSVPIICLCFTPLRAVYDEAYRERHLVRQGLARMLAQIVEMGYRFVDKLLWRKYTKVIAISDVVKQRIVKGRLAFGNDIEVLYPGIEDKSDEKNVTFEDYFLLPGRIMWTKNIELGIQAFLAFKAQTGSNHRLIIAGMVDDKSKPYFKKLKQLSKSNSDIEFHVNLSDSELNAWYERCYAVLFTAFNEDLGLIPLEAGVRYKPTIAVDCGGPRETVVDGETGLLVSAKPEKFAAAMKFLVDDLDLTMSMGRAAKKRCGQFTWDSFVTDLDSELDKIAGQ